MSNDTRILSKPDVLSILGVSVPNGNAQINSVRTAISYCHELTCTGDVSIMGFIRTPLKLTYGIQFPPGSAANPSISFTTAPTSGIFYTGTAVGFAAGGTEVMNVGPLGTSMSGPITTPGGQDLVLNPSGSNIDCTNHNLVNVAGMFANPNRYEVIAPATVITTDATPTVLYNIPTVSDSGYLLVTNVTCVDDTNDVSTAGFTFTGKVKNIGGVLSIIATGASGTTIIDNPLVGIAVNYGITGTNATVVVTGLPATSIKWFGATVVTRQLF